MILLVNIQIMKVLKFNENVDMNGAHYYKKIDSSTSSMYIKIEGDGYIKIFTVGDYVKIIKDPKVVDISKYSKFLPSNVDEFNSAMETAIATIKG